MKVATEVFQEFLEFCSVALKGENPKFIELITKRFEDCDETFRNSDRAAELIEQTQQSMKTDKSRMFVYLKDFMSELKTYAKSKKSKGNRDKKANHSPQTEMSGQPSLPIKLDECKVRLVKIEPQAFEDYGCNSGLYRTGRTGCCKMCMIGDGKVDQALVIREASDCERMRVMSQLKFPLNQCHLLSYTPTLRERLSYRRCGRRLRFSSVSGGSSDLSVTETATVSAHVYGENTGNTEDGGHCRFTARKRSHTGQKSVRISNMDKDSDSTSVQIIEAAQFLSYPCCVHKAKKRKVSVKTELKKDPSWDMASSKDDTPLVKSSHGLLIPLLNMKHAVVVINSLSVEDICNSSSSSTDGGSRVSGEDKGTDHHTRRVALQTVASTSELHHEKGQGHRDTSHAVQIKAPKDESWTPAVVRLEDCMPKAGDSADEFESKPGSTTSSVPNNVDAADRASGGNTTDERNKRHVKKLEHLLEALRNKIEECQQQDLSLDDLSAENSFYILEDKLKKKFVAAWTKLCEITGRTVTTGRATEKTIRYNGTRYKEINRRLEKFLNKRKIFPDFHDVKNVVMLSNKKFNLRMSSMQVNSVAREAFVDIGNMLKMRRHQDFVANFGNRQTDTFRSSEDPYLMSSELRQKMDRNQRIGRINLEDIINKYVKLQNKLHTNETEDEDEEEEEEEEKEHERHYRDQCQDGDRVWKNRITECAEEDNEIAVTEVDIEVDVAGQSDDDICPSDGGCEQPKSSENNGGPYSSSPDKVCTKNFYDSMSRPTGSSYNALTQRLDTNPYLHGKRLSHDLEATTSHAVTDDGLGGVGHSEGGTAAPLEAPGRGNKGSNLCESEKEICLNKGVQEPREDGIRGSGQETGNRSSNTKTNIKFTARKVLAPAVFVPNDDSNDNEIMSTLSPAGAVPDVGKESGSKFLKFYADHVATENEDDCDDNSEDSDEESDKDCNADDDDDDLMIIDDEKMSENESDVSTCPSPVSVISLSSTEGDHDLNISFSEIDGKVNIVSIKEEGKDSFDAHLDSVPSQIERSGNLPWSNVRELSPSRKGRQLTNTDVVVILDTPEKPVEMNCNDVNSAAKANHREIAGLSDAAGDDQRSAVTCVDKQGGDTEVTTGQGHSGLAHPCDTKISSTPDLLKPHLESVEGFEDSQSSSVIVINESSQSNLSCSRTLQHTNTSKSEGGIDDEKTVGDGGSKVYGKTDKFQQSTTPTTKDCVVVDLVDEEEDIPERNRGGPNEVAGGVCSDESKTTLNSVKPTTEICPVGDDEVQQMFPMSDRKRSSVEVIEVDSLSEGITHGDSNADVSTQNSKRPLPAVAAPCSHQGDEDVEVVVEENVINTSAQGCDLGLLSASGTDKRAEVVSGESTPSQCSNSESTHSKKGRTGCDADVYDVDLHIESKGDAADSNTALVTANRENNTEDVNLATGDMLFHTLKACEGSTLSVDTHPEDRGEAVHTDNSPVQIEDSQDGDTESPSGVDSVCARQSECKRVDKEPEKVGMSGQSEVLVTCAGSGGSELSSQKNSEIVSVGSSQGNVLAKVLGESENARHVEESEGDKVVESEEFRGKVSDSSLDTQDVIVENGEPSHRVGGCSEGIGDEELVAKDVNSATQIEGGDQGSQKSPVEDVCDIAKRNLDSDSDAVLSSPQRHVGESDLLSLRSESNKEGEMVSGNVTSPSLGLSLSNSAANPLEWSNDNKSEVYDSNVSKCKGGDQLSAQVCFEQEDSDLMVDSVDDGFACIDKICKSILRDPDSFPSDCSTAHSTQEMKEDTLECGNGAVTDATSAVRCTDAAVRDTDAVVTGADITVRDTDTAVIDSSPSITDTATAFLMLPMGCASQEGSGVRSKDHQGSKDGCSPVSGSDGQNEVLVIEESNNEARKNEEAADDELEIIEVMSSAKGRMTSVRSKEEDRKIVNELLTNGTLASPILSHNQELKCSSSEEVVASILIDVLDTVCSQADVRAGVVKDRVESRLESQPVDLDVAASNEEVEGGLKNKKRKACDAPVEANSIKDFDNDDDLMIIDADMKPQQKKAKIVQDNLNYILDEAVIEKVVLDMKNKRFTSCIATTEGSNWVNPKHSVVGRTKHQTPVTSSLGNIRAEQHRVQNFGVSRQYASSSSNMRFPSVQSKHRSIQPSYISSGLRTSAPSQQGRGSFQPNTYIRSKPHSLIGLQQSRGGASRQGPEGSSSGCGLKISSVVSLNRNPLMSDVKPGQERALPQRSLHPRFKHKPSSLAHLQQFQGRPGLSPRPTIRRDCANNAHISSSGIQTSMKLQQVHKRIPSAATHTQGQSVRNKRKGQDVVEILSDESDTNGDINDLGQMKTKEPNSHVLHSSSRSIPTSGPAAKCPKISNLSNSAPMHVTRKSDVIELSDSE